MNKAEKLKLLVDSGRTVFRPIDFQLIWQDTPVNAKISAKRMVQAGLLIKLAKGIYALNKKYNTFELANILVSPSYVSFGSALSYANVSFAPAQEIYSVALYGKTKNIDESEFTYVSMKKELFYNVGGINIFDGFYIASVERAILDSFYFGFLFDVNVEDAVNKTYLKELGFYYPETVQKKIKALL